MYSLRQQLLGTYLVKHPLLDSECVESQEFPAFLMLRPATQQEACDYDASVLGDFVGISGVIELLANSPEFCEAVQDCVGNSLEDFVYDDDANAWNLVIAAHFDTTNGFVDVAGDGTTSNPFVVTLKTEYIASGTPLSSTNKIITEDYKCTHSEVLTLPANTSYVLNHGLGTDNVMVQTFSTATGEQIFVCNNIMLGSPDEIELRSTVDTEVLVLVSKC